MTYPTLALSNATVLFPELQVSQITDSLKFVLGWKAAMKHPHDCSKLLTLTCCSDSTKGTCDILLLLSRNAVLNKRRWWWWLYQQIENTLFAYRNKIKKTYHHQHSIRTKLQSERRAKQQLYFVSDALDILQQNLDVGTKWKMCSI